MDAEIIMKASCELGDGASQILVTAISACERYERKREAATSRFESGDLGEKPKLSMNNAIGEKACSITSISDRTNIERTR